MKHRHAVHIRHCDQVIVGHWSLDDMHRTVTVESLCGRKSGHLGAAQPQALAEELLRELVAEVPEGVTAL